MNIEEDNFSEGHALIISVANYSQVNPLPDTILNDGRDMYLTLTSPSHCGYKTSNVSILLDDEATLAAIRSELKGLADRAKSSDTVVIFFSGHGTRLGEDVEASSALIPFDCSLDNILESVMSEEEFSLALKNIQASRIVVFIDACHSGASISFKNLSSCFSNQGYSEKSLSRLAEGNGRVLIASSRASEYSLVFNGARNSLFTEHLLNVLRGGGHTHGDGVIRVFDVFNHVSEQVRLAAPGKQHPIFKASDLEDNFPIALDCGGVKRLTDIVMPNEQQDIWRDLGEILCDLYPVGPQDEDIWLRSGGDTSRLRLSGTGRANWLAALRLLRQGGGGKNITKVSLIDEVLNDFPHHQQLKNLKV
ncbi:caspase family protein [Limnobaculum xujianqingii]|uniref:caspase family protein n=1 Tax=Limnobaculum xujianqingii TaxID=2738837 RepID=UPI001126336F|nr:caspase family protein [Limnobaculum xujianqingii]